MYRQRRARKTVNMKHLVLGGAALAVIAVILILVLGAPKTMLADTGEIAFERGFDAVIIRDEKVYETENYEKAVFIAAEGEKVKKGSGIAEVYKWGYNDKVLNELLELQKKIKEYQEKNLLKDIINIELKAFNEQIDAKSSDVEKVIAGEKEGDIITLERELKKLMTDRKDYLEEAVKADEHLEDLYEQEETLLSRIDEWKKVIMAASDGYVSFYFDGCEQFMNIQNMDKLVRKNIDNILKGEVSVPGREKNAERPLYRLVEANKWYMLVYSDEKVQEFLIDARFTLAFEDVYNRQFTGTIQEERRDGRGYIYTFYIADDVSALLRARRIRATVQHTYEGLKLPVSAVKEKDGAYGVYVKKDGASIFVPVSVSIRQDGEAIVLPLEQDSILQKNAQVVY